MLIPLIYMLLLPLKSLFIIHYSGKNSYVTIFSEEQWNTPYSIDIDDDGVDESFLISQDIDGDGFILEDEEIDFAENNGVERSKIIVDPGFGFAKNLNHNLEIIRRLSEYKFLESPILIGPSRKSTIGKILDLPVDDRLEGTSALVAVSIYNGANIVRVHDVRNIVRIAKMTDALVHGFKKS